MKMTVSTYDLAKQLHPLEIRTLHAFDVNESRFTSELIDKTGMKKAQLRMALEWLLNKTIIAVVQERKEVFISLTDVSRNLKDGRPLENRILDLIAQNNNMEISLIAEKLNEGIKETNIAVSNLKKSGIITIQKGGIVALFKGGNVSKYSGIQNMVNLISEKGFCNKDEFSSYEWDIISANSHKRGKDKGLFRIIEKTDKQYNLTDIGKSVLNIVIKRGFIGEEISQLTPQMLKDGSWKNASFRAYNIHGQFPRIVTGRKNPYRQYLDFVKRKMISLGFEEMRGPLVESEFWNMDALYMPQFHAAREIHDAYFVKEPACPAYCNDIPEPNYSNVAYAHSSGKKYGSKGWRYKFNKERARRLVLRSQGTALSVRQLANKPKIPGKYFSIARCFRYDTVDSTHAPDFFQVEGIVLGEDINFRHLLGILKLFAIEVANSKELKFSADYFPFTEPSVEVSIKHSSLGWVELGGAGIFRPEVTRPHGIDVPVIAWGLGLDRMAMVALGIDDIRDMFTVDLEIIRKKRVCRNI
jgi:phenylalanyl-tRNA synthetase alpha chain